MQPDHKPFNLTYFFRWVLNKKSFTILLTSLLVFLNILVFSKISFLFKPVLALATVVMLPMVISALLYYLLEPSVRWLEKRGIGRTGAIAFVFVAVVLLLLLGVSSIIPMFQSQLAAFFNNLPTYIQNMEEQVYQILQDQRLEQFRPQLADLLDNVSQKAIEYAQTFSQRAVDWASSLATVITKVAVAIMISPFILFYLLRDGDQLGDKMVSVLPPKMRKPSKRILADINRQFSSYVQGQVTVAVIVGVMFSILFSLIKLPYAVTLGILAGVLNMVPYLGSFLATIPALILGAVGGPVLLLKVIIAFIVEQTIEGRFVSPLVLGSKLDIHPITILFVLLTSGSLFGVWGVLLGIPVYAASKVLVIELFEWYKSVSGLYMEEENFSDDQ